MTAERLRAELAAVETSSSGVAASAETADSARPGHFVPESRQSRATMLA